MQLSFVDVRNELREVAREAAHVAAALTRTADSVLSDEQTAWERGHVLASGTERIYTGCERVMSRLVAEIDETKVIAAEGWHRALLLRVASPIPGLRDAIISARCCAALDRLRAFRHRVRNSYGFDLDGDIVVERAGEAVRAFAMFEAEVEAFMTSWSRPILRG